MDMGNSQVPQTNAPQGGGDMLGMMQEMMAKMDEMMSMMQQMMSSDSGESNQPINSDVMSQAIGNMKKGGM